MSVVEASDIYMNDVVARGGATKVRVDEALREYARSRGDGGAVNRLMAVGTVMDPEKVEATLSLVDRARRAVGF